MAACILAKGETTIYNVPELTDVSIMLEVIGKLGAKISYNIKEKYLTIDATNLTGVIAPYELVSKMRASFIILGALMARCNEAIVALPGGCAIGERRVDFHIKGLESLGAEISIENGYVHAKAKKLVGTDIYLDIPSVGATENLMLASVTAEGSTRIQNAAQEPEIVDLANFLNTMGADISGAGTSEIVINGVKQENLHAIQYTTIPDRIEAGTYMSAIVATGGKGIIKNIYPNHLTFFTSKLIKMGANVKLIDPTAIEVSSNKKLSAVNIVTQPYPGFPTDLQSLAMAMLTIADGVSIITESLYENRFMHVNELAKIGIKFSLDDYGTGYSNIWRITKLPFEIIKLDKSFVDDLNKPGMKIVISETISMLKKLNKKILIEGVETFEEFDYFRTVGCDYVQGYYFSKPISQTDFIEFIKKSKAKQLEQ